MERSSLSNKIDLNDAPDGVIKIPQYYYNSRGQKEYNQLMREIFKYGETLEISEIHKRIIAFKIDTIITTNYDNLIELAAEENGEFMQVISQDKDLPYRKNSRELIKMHVDFEHDNFVLKEDDYLNYSRNFRLIENYIKSIIGTKVFLERHLNKKARRGKSKNHLKGPKKRTELDDLHFRESFERMVQKVLDM